VLSHTILRDSPFSTFVVKFWWDDLRDSSWIGLDTKEKQESFGMGTPSHSPFFSLGVLERSSPDFEPAVVQVDGVANSMKSRSTAKVTSQQTPPENAVPPNVTIPNIT